jgi:hypothetical protein
MKKNFVKKLAVALSLAMTVSTLAPAASADAAATPAFKTYRTSVYENGTNGGSYTYTVKNIKKGYTVKWSVTGDAKDYITVSKASTKATKTTVSNKITVNTNGASIGKSGATATVKAVVYNTKGTKVKTVSDKVTVKVQATDVSIYAADETNFVTAVGAAYDLNRTLTPANSTSKTYWEVTDASGSAVDIIDSQGVMTATAAGEYTVTANVKNSKTAKTVATATQKVTVKTAVLKSATQAKANEITATFAGDVSKLTASDISIKRNSDNVVFPVKAVSTDKNDATKLTLTTYSDLKDGKEYTVTYGDDSVTFVATDGTVASLAIEPATVPYGEGTEIYVTGKDAQGIELFSYKNSTKEAKMDIDVTVTSGTGYYADDKLTLSAKGDTAKVVATLHTYEYNTDGTEKDVLKAEATITAVDPAAASFSATKYTVADSLDWDDTLNTKLTLGSTGMKLYYNLKDEKGNDVTSKYTITESTDNNILIAGTSATSVSSSSYGVSITPVKEGTAYVLVKDANGNVVASFAVTVVAAAKATSITVTPANLTLSNNVNDSASAKVVVKDQYGNVMTTESNAATVTLKSKPSGDNVTAPSIVSGTSVITASTSSAEATKTTKGTYVYDVTYGTLKATLVVSVQAANTALESQYKLDLSTTSLDTTITKDSFSAEAKANATSAAIAANITVGEYKGGVKVGLATITAVEVINDSNNKTVETAGVVGATTDGVTSVAITAATAGAVSKGGFSVSGGSITKLLGAGTYTVKVTFENASKTAITATTKLTVADTQAKAVSYNQVSQTTTDSTIDNAVKNKDVVTYKQGETDITDTATTASTDYVNNGKIYSQIYVTVKITVPVGDGDQTWTVPVKVLLPNSITIQ